MEMGTRQSPFLHGDPHMETGIMNFSHMETVVNFFHMGTCQSPFPYRDPRMVMGIHLCQITVWKR
jgi:hypothetical protein